MKIVLNKCYGGFELSMLAQKEYLKLKGKKAFFYKQTKYKFNGEIEEYTRIDDLTKEIFNTHTYTKDFGKTFTPAKGNEKYYWYYRDIERTDIDLIEVVEKLKEKANGKCSELEIVEIPDDVSWELSDYDGIERVKETHRSW